MKKIIIIVVFVIIMLLCLSIGLHYYVSQPIESKEVLCHKGKLIHRLGDNGTVYLKVKGVSCVFENGMIIIEE